MLWMAACEVACEPACRGGVGGAVARGHAAEGEHATHAGGDDRLVAGVGGVGALRAKAGDGAVDERGIACGELLVAGAERFGLARTRARDDHISAFGEAGEGVAVRFGGEVEHGAALAPQPHGRVGQAAPRIAAGTLDLDDLSAEVGEGHRGHAADRPFAEVEDEDVVEKCGHGRRLRR